MPFSSWEMLFLKGRNTTQQKELEYWRKKQDLKMFKRLFSDDNFKPDMLKIYPCLVTKGSELYDLWEEGKYAPYKYRIPKKQLMRQPQTQAVPALRSCTVQ